MKTTKLDPVCVITWSTILATCGYLAYSVARLFWLNVVPLIFNL